ncbi:MAG: D-alanyl-D-alanine carboxypeptidase/D-alanyl-D-alanine-endopeptidase, partial [Melioribacteraceae bacterium]
YEPGEIGKSARIELIPRTDFFKIINTSETIDSGKSDLNITRDWINRKNTISIKGSLSKSTKRDTVSLNVFNPTFYFLNLMKESFVKSGISFTGKVDTMTLNSEAYKIFSLKRDLDRVIINTNKTSDNLSAEMLLRALALKYSGHMASAKKGIVLIDSLISLVGLNPKNYMIVDGSGLSFYNLLSAELLTEVLKYFYFKQPDLSHKLSNSFPVSGFDGTLSNRMKKSVAFKRVFAKTGTIRGVSSLSGYLISRNNHMIAFSILIQNFTGGSNQARSIQDIICKIIIETN